MDGIILRVQVLSCCDLPASDPNGKSDPYIVVCFGRQEWRTPVIDATLDPVYRTDATFDINISEDAIRTDGALLHITVMDKDRFKDDHLAGLSLQPSEWFRGTNVVDNVPAYGFGDPGNQSTSYSLYCKKRKGFPTIQLKLGLVAIAQQNGWSMARVARTLEDAVSKKADTDRSNRTAPQR